MGVRVGTGVDVSGRVRVVMRVWVWVRRWEPVRVRVPVRRRMSLQRTAVHASQQRQHLRLRQCGGCRRRRRRCWHQEVRREDVRDEGLARVERAAGSGAVAPLAAVQRNGVECRRRCRRRRVGREGRVRDGRKLRRRGGQGEGTELRRELREQVRIVQQERGVERVLLMLGMRVCVCVRVKVRRGKRRRVRAQARWRSRKA